jgi:hypothetical protein
MWLRPLSFRCVRVTLFKRVSWSGRLDSNQRPLPPERTAPTRTPRFSVVSHRGKVLSNAPCSRPVHGPRFAANLGALSLRGAA